MIQTTVIGSYPSRLDGKAYAKAYHMSEPQDAGDETMRAAVTDIVGAGIDIVADGQTRSDFISLFARCFSGIVMQGRPVVIDEIEYVRQATIADQKAVRKMLPKDMLLKGIVTGPYTIAKNSQDRRYKDLQELSFAYARGLAKEVEALSDICDFVQVDEPYFSVDLPEYAKDLVGKVMGKAKVPKMLHVCGDVSDQFASFVEFPVDYLEHEFAASPGIWDVACEIDFAQTLGVGVARSDINEIDTVDVICERMKQAMDNRDPKKLMFNPDCGLRNLDVDVARAKLENIVTARNSLQKD